MYSFLHLHFHIRFPFFRPESKPKNNVKNYLEKSRKLGYRGDRENFQKLEMDLDKEADLIKEKLAFFGIFKSVKEVLDSVPSVNSECY